MATSMTREFYDCMKRLVIYDFEICAGINKRQTRQTKQASLTSFVENTNKRHADYTQSTPLTNSQTTNMAATSPVTPVLEAATTNNTTDTSNDEVTNNDIKLLQLERRLSQSMSGMNSQLSDKIDNVKSTVNRLTDRVEKVESENVELHNRISECEKSLHEQTTCLKKPMS